LKGKWRPSECRRGCRPRLMVTKTNKVSGINAHQPLDSISAKLIEQSLSILCLRCPFLLMVTCTVAETHPKVSDEQHLLMTDVMSSAETCLFASAGTSTAKHCKPQVARLQKLSADCDFSIWIAGGRNVQLRPPQTPDQIAYGSPGLSS
jgi:hypothetical protein